MVKNNTKIKKFKGISNKNNIKFDNTYYGSFSHPKNLRYAKTIDPIPANNNEDIIEI